MKKYIVFIILFISTITALSQPITYKKNFPDVKNFRAIIESGDGNYVLSYQDSSNRMNLMKVDPLGNTVWQKKLSGSEIRITYANLIKGPVGNFYFVGCIYDTLAIFKINGDGNIVKTSKRKLPIGSMLLYSVDYPAIYKLDDNPLLVSYVIYDAQDHPRFVIAKLDSDLNIIWEKMLEGIRYTSDITISMGKIILLLNGDIRLLNFTGNIETTITSPEIYERVLTCDANSFFIFGWQKVLRMDFLGNIIAEQGVPLLDRDSPFINNDKFAELWIFYGNHIYIYNKSSNTFSSKKFDLVYPSSIIQTPDGGFIYCGGNYIVKLDENGNLILPASLSINNLTGAFPVNTPVTISWRSNELTGKAKIDVSYDNGLTWQTITDKVNIEDEIFNWLTPDILASRCLLRITSIDFPQYTSTQTSSFKIILQPQTENYIAINEFKMNYKIDGEGSSIGSNPGLFWPGGKSATQSLVFSEGLIWTGSINGVLQANGTLYRTGLQSGNILNGNTPNKDAEILKAWKFRSDFDLLPFGSQKNKYIYDFLNWPTSIGAPWIDKNKNGIYEPESGDTPKIIGDEMHWMVMNDLDTAKSLKLFGSKPIGFEIQLSVFGFKDNPQLKDVLFKKYLVINKSNKTILNMYFSYFCDDDIGWGYSDFVGCDTTLNLGFAWTSTNYNAQYEFNPPSVGHIILQGPLVKGEPTDKGVLNGIVRTGYKNLGMTTFAANYKNDISVQHDPYLGSYQGTIEVNNLIRGLINDGSPVINPLTNQPSHYHLSGDPETGSGWIEGKVYPQLKTSYRGGGADRRYYITSGPFDFAPKDTQEIVIAVLAARGTSNKNSVTLLKNLARTVNQLYSTDIFKKNLNENIAFKAENKVYQNYPNPFNSDTNISYQLTKPSHVTLKIYDVLGREILTLINEDKNAGRYINKFDMATAHSYLHLSSGIYFYRFTAGDFSDVKKMIYMK